MSDSIKEHIGEYGWHCLHVFPTDDKHDRFTYSIGFAETFGAPEVMIFGLLRERAHALLAECAGMLKAGGSIQCEAEDDRILAGDYKVIFRRVQSAAFDEYLGTACRYYGGSEFSAVIMFLPDKSHRFPWQLGYNDVNADEPLSIV